MKIASPVNPRWVRIAGVLLETPCPDNSLVTRAGCGVCLAVALELAYKAGRRSARQQPKR